MVSVQAQIPVLSSKGSASAESSLGSYVADAVRLAAKADVAVVPSSLLRDVDIPADKLTAQAVQDALMDSGQNIAVLVITGAQLRDAIERSVGLYPRPNAGFLQVSGITFRFEPSAKQGERLGEITINRRPVSPDQSLRVAMPASLASGALGYFRVWGDVKPTDEKPGTIGKAIESFLASEINLEEYAQPGRIRKI